jgi:hypothetical protein
MTAEGTVGAPTCFREIVAVPQKKVDGLKHNQSLLALKENIFPQCCEKSIFLFLFLLSPLFCLGKEID